MYREERRDVRTKNGHEEVVIDLPNHSIITKLVVRHVGPAINFRFSVAAYNSKKAASKLIMLDDCLAAVVPTHGDADGRVALHGVAYDFLDQDECHANIGKLRIVIRYRPELEEPQDFLVCVGGRFEHNHDGSPSFFA